MKREKSKKGNRVILALLRDCKDLCAPCKCRILKFLTQKYQNAGVFLEGSRYDVRDTQ